MKSSWRKHRGRVGVRILLALALAAMLGSGACEKTQTETPPGGGTGEPIPLPATEDTGEPGGGAEDAGNAGEGTPLILVQVDPVLEDRSGEAQASTERRTGHKRFYEISYQVNPEAGDRLLQRIGVGSVPETHSEEKPAYTVVPPLHPVCRSDRFFVAFPLSEIRGGDLPEPDAFIADLSDRLSGQANEKRSLERWFQPPQAGRGPELTVADWALAHVVDDIRQGAVEVAGALAVDQPAKRLLVGRVCGFVGMGVEEVTTEPMRSWHLERMGLTGNQKQRLTAAFAGVTAPVVDLALVDAGVDPDLVSKGLTRHRAADAPDAAVLRHGTGMALLLQSIAPPEVVQIHSYRVFDKEGQTTARDVGRAIDHALHELDRENRPLVINLSLGWPPELRKPHRQLATVLPSGAPSQLAYLQKRTSEDPAGEVVRYMLYLARQMDAERGKVRRPVFVVAAAGNRPGLPGHVEWDRLLGAPPNPQADPCERGGTPVESSWFYPAAWSRVPTCRMGATDREAHVDVAYPVAATSYEEKELPAFVSRPDDESPLVAPGEKIYAYNPTGGAPGSATAPDKGFPLAFTGTSASAALTSSAAAVAQALRLTQHREAFDWPTLGRLLYLTGDPLANATGTPRVSRIGKLPVRRLSVCRLQAAIKPAPPCVDLVTCVEGLTPTVPVFDSALLAQCQAAADRCVTTDPALCAPGAVEPRWPVTYVASSLGTVVPGVKPPNAPCGLPAGTACPAAGAGCHADCAHWQVPDWYSLDGIGPQPGEDGCPDCLLRAPADAQGLTPESQLVLDLAPDIIDYAVDAWVEIRWGGGAPSERVEDYCTSDCDFYPPQSGNDWIASAHITAKGFDNAALGWPTTAGQWKTAGLQAVLVIKFRKWWGRVYYLSESVLTVDASAQ